MTMDTTARDAALRITGAWRVVRETQTGQTAHRIGTVHVENLFSGHKVYGVTLCGSDFEITDRQVWWLAELDEVKSRYGVDYIPPCKRCAAAWRKLQREAE
jgi:hypothetical protein